MGSRKFAVNACSFMKGVINMFKKKSKLNLERLKLQVEIVEHLLKYRFTWEEIYKGIGFSKEWYWNAKQLIEQHKGKS